MFIDYTSPSWSHGKQVNANDWKNKHRKHGLRSVHGVRIIGAHAYLHNYGDLLLLPIDNR